MTQPLAACPECDALHSRPALRRGEKARCQRCGAVLYSVSWLGRAQLLPLAVAALICFVMANAFPIVALEVQGQSNSATLLGSILALWQDDRRLVAVMVFATTLAFPLLDLLGMLWLLTGHDRKAWTWRLIQHLRPWGMTEVFMLGLLVSLVKLSHMARLIPGAALWAFAALTILMALILTFDPRSLWEDEQP